MLVPRVIRLCTLGRDDLEAAKRNLLNLASFGLVEDMDRATFAISDRLGLPQRN